MSGGHSIDDPGHGGSINALGLGESIHHWREHMAQLPGSPITFTIDSPDGESSVQVTTDAPSKDSYAIAFGIVDYFLKNSNFKNDDRMHPPNNNNNGSGGGGMGGS